MQIERAHVSTFFKSSIHTYVEQYPSEWCVLLEAKGWLMNIGRIFAALAWLISGVIIANTSLWITFAGIISNYIILLKIHQFWMLFSLEPIQGVTLREKKTSNNSFCPTSEISLNSRTYSGENVEIKNLLSNQTQLWFSKKSNGVEISSNSGYSSSINKTHTKKTHNQKEMMKLAQVFRSPWFITNWKTRFKRLTDMAIKKNMIQIYNTIGIFFFLRMSERSIYIYFHWLSVFFGFSSKSASVNAVASFSEFDR